jgi:hypothetical protein
MNDYERIERVLWNVVIPLLVAVSWVAAVHFALHGGS